MRDMEKHCPTCSAPPGATCKPTCGDLEALWRAPTPPPPAWDPLTAKVWDEYVLAGIRTRLEVPEAVDQADRLLAARKKRFGAPMLPAVDLNVGGSARLK